MVFSSVRSDITYKFPSALNPFFIFHILLPRTK